MESSVFFGLSTVAYVLAMIAYITYIAFKNKTIGLTATGITVFGLFSQTIAILMRWSEFHRMTGMGLIRSIPLTNLFESLIFFVWCLILGYLIIEFRYKNRSFGAFVTPVAAMALAFINLSGMSKDIQPLVPALQSNWLLVHVMMSFISYSTFAIAFSTALMYLIVNTERQRKKTLFWGVFLAFALLFGLTSLYPQTVIMWIISFALVAVVDIKLNVDISRRIFPKEKGTGGLIKNIGLIIGLSLVSAAAIFIFIQLVKFQLIKAEEAAKMKHLLSPASAAEFKGAVMGVVALMFFIGLAALKYLILQREFYLFWTLILGVSVALLAAMGIDFLKLNIAGGMAPGKSLTLKSTFRSSQPAVVLASYTGFTILVYLIWRYGGALKRIISSFKISPDMLDELTYKAISIGFPIFTLGGLIFGAIWADQAWGVYWSWDPKETWSLITWFFYAFYLHARLLRGWRGLRVSVVAVLSFTVVIFTYLGVNLLLSGLHAYGGME
jgi:cytochrome c-type biogenesis protein CcsB